MGYASFEGRADVRLAVVDIVGMFWGAPVSMSAASWWGSLHGISRLYVLMTAGSRGAVVPSGRVGRSTKASKVSATPIVFALPVCDDFFVMGSEVSNPVHQSARKNRGSGRVRIH